MITINIAKAKTIAHEIRRTAREKEFEPFDLIISKQLPNQIETAEVERQKIREKYEVMQTAIDSCSSINEIKSVLGL